MTATEVTSRSHARASGATRYFTGNPCIHGHLCERRTSNHRCIECERIEAKSPERAAQIESWAKANPHRRKVIVASYREKNREKLREKTRERRARDIEKSRRQTRKSVYRWRQQNLEKARARGAEYRARRAAAEGSYSAADIQRIFCEQGGKCAYCRVKLTSKNRRIDHINPIALGGSNWPSNLQLLCQPCNSTKSSKHPIDFARSRGLLI